ncbi:MAG TPA: MBL fold metallo-hydrolase [Polyangiales bacterium]
MSIEIEFVGAAQSVTGSRHLVRSAKSTILLDCGMFQGKRSRARERNERLGFRAQDVDAVVLSHAHIDHSGVLPMLCKQGYRGSIYATPATRDLCAVMLMDAALIQAADARFLNRAIERDHVDAEPISPLYEQDDVQQVLTQLIAVPYHHRQQIAEDAWVTLWDAGHVLGSAVVALELEDEGSTKRLVFSGDLGRHGLPILRDPEVPTGADCLLLESTYGDRLHPSVEAMDEQLAAVITRCQERGGKVIIPSFALERAQEVLFELKKLRQQQRIPAIPVYVDSPLTVSVTSIFRLHPDCFDRESRVLVQEGESPFDFPGLTYVTDVEQSKALSASREPAVVISASGMCEAGRVLHHLRAAIEDPRNAVVIVGFMAEHTLGRRIVERRPRVKIFGVERDLRAEVVVLNGFSAHADQRGLIDFAERCRAQGPLRQVALVHGELAAQQALQGQLLARGFPNVSIPAERERLRV